MLESGALSDPAFPAFAKSVVLFLHNTSRVEDEPYPTLLKDKGFGGFPSLCFMDADGNVTVRQGARTVDGFETTAQRVKVWSDLKTKAQKGDADTKRKLFLAEAELGMLDAAAIRKQMAELQLGPDDKKATDRALADAEIRELRGKARELGADKVAEEMVAMAKAGRIPGPDSAMAFWPTVLTWAAKNGDAKLAQQAFDELSRLKLSDAMRKRFEQMLEDAKAKGN